MKGALAWGALLLAGGLLLPAAAHAHFQTRSPASCVSFDVGNPGWNNPDRAQSSNNSHATSTVGDNQATDALACVQYGFTIPATSTVLGVIVRVERSASGGGAPKQDFAVRVLKGGIAEPADRSTTTAYTNADVIEAHGTSTDLWGTTWTAADINDPNFGAAFMARKNGTAGGNATISVDHIEIEVHYSEPPPAPALVSPADAATVATGTPAFDWSDVADPDGDTATYEIQADDSGCAFASPEVSQAGLAASAFTPGSALANGTYCWRARALDEHGLAGPWSATRNVTVSSAGGTSGSQTMSPNACTSLGGPGENWSNSGNAESSDNQRAAARVNDGEITDPLQCLDYGFTIPPNAIILGIEVMVERRSSNAGSVRDNTLFLVKAGSAVGADGAASTFYTTSDTVEPHGGPSDLWGATWTPAEINAADFGTVYTGIKPGSTGGNRDIDIDHIAITVYYSIPALATPGSFNAFETGTAAGALTGVIKTKIAGAPFSLDVVAIASGAQLAAFSDAITVELLGNNTLGVTLDANNCPTTFTLLQTVSPDPAISAGRSNVGFAAVANSWRDVRVRMRHPVGSPTVTSCSTDNFAIRPSAFAGLTVSDNDWQTAGNGRTLSAVTFGALTHKAGRPFSVSASAVNAAGTPAVTTNYAGTPTASLSTCAGAACTAGFGTLTLSSAFAAGQLLDNSASYDNVGSFALQLVDSTFASVDATDSTPGERNIASAAFDVGRFVPDHFAVSLNAPAFGTACGSFTYVGQAFTYATAPVVTVTAQGFANNTTTLYAGNWWRLTNASLAPGSQAARYNAAAGTLDLSLLPGVAADPTIADNGLGLGTLTFSTAGIAFNRAAPVAPFDADIALSINVIDADGIAFGANPVAFGTATPGNGIAFPAGKGMRFGRLRLENAVGSERADLPISIQTQYWTGTTFQVNGADNCTSISAANVGFSGYFGGITAANMNGANISGLAAPFASGIGSLLLTRPLPVPGSPGAVTLAIDLTTEAKSYLKGNWGVPTFTADPASRAAFGLYGSQPNNFIYFRENF